VKLEQPLKCGAAFPVTVKYSFVGETGNYNTDIIYMVTKKYEFYCFLFSLGTFYAPVSFVRSCPEE